MNFLGFIRTTIIYYLKFLWENTQKGDYTYQIND